MKLNCLHSYACCFALLAIVACKKEPPVNKAPMAFAGNDTTIIQHVDDISLRLALPGSGTDADGSITGYSWRKIAGAPTAGILNTSQSTATATGLVVGSYQFELTVTDDQGATDIDSIRIAVNPPAGLELLLRPGPSEAQMCMVVQKLTSPGHPAYTNNKNLNMLPELSASAWTFNAEGIEKGYSRSYLKFTGLSALAANKQVLSAKLTLYGLNPNTSGYAPQGNSFYPKSGYGNTNPSWLRRVVSNWTATTITWDNKPATVTLGQVAVPASTKQWNYDVVDIDVTELVKYMVSERQNYGFSLELQTEVYYRCILFASSKSAEPSLRPKLLVNYK